MIGLPTATISIIPAACLMLKAGAAIAAIRSQLARLAIIDPFHATVVYPKSFFINRLLSDTPLDPAARRMPRSPPFCFYPSSMQRHEHLPAKFLEPLEFFQGLGEKNSKPSIYSPSPPPDQSHKIPIKYLTMSQGSIAFLWILLCPGCKRLTESRIFSSREEIMLQLASGPSYYLNECQSVEP